MDPVEREEHLENVLQAIDRKEYLRALSEADQWLAEDPADATGYSMRALVLIRLGRFRDALEDARRARQLEPHDPQVVMVFAMAAEAENRLSWAQEAWEEAVQLSHSAPAVLREFARFMVDHRGPKPALEAARRAVEADRNNSQAWSLLAAAQLRMHRFQEAEESLKRALALDPNNVQAQALMAQYLLLRGKQNEALAISKLLQDHEQARPIVEWIQGETRKRNLERILVERALDLEARRPDPGSWRWFSLMWWVLAYTGALAVALVLDVAGIGNWIFLLVLAFLGIHLVLWALLFRG
ncbi:MAG: tetratricopeptide repeat protein [Thermogutta sp.]